MSSDDNNDIDDEDDEEEFNFDNLFVSHLDDILGYMYCSADKGIDDVMLCRSRTCKVGLADTLLHDMQFKLETSAIFNCFCYFSSSLAKRSSR